MANEYLSALKNYAEFSGRSTRQEYWMFVLYNLLVSIGIMAIDGAVLKTNGLIYNLYNLALFLPSIAVGVRRMHDAGRSGWWLLVPLVNLVFLCSASVDPDTNERPKMSGLAIFGVICLALIPVIGILAAIALPAYQTYTIKAKMAEVMGVGEQAEYSVASYIEKNGHSPVDMNQTEFSATSRYISNVAVDPASDEITLTLSFNPFVGKKIILRPAGGADPTLWTCSAIGIYRSYLPANCI